MSDRFSSIAVLLAVAAIAVGSGPAGGAAAPRRVMPPAIDAEKAGRLAIAQYDANRDGLIDRQELEKAPALKASIGNLDTNKDRKVSGQEIAARVQSWKDSKIGLMSLACTVTLDGKSLSGATVTFQPEECLGPEVPSASGRTDNDGLAAISRPLTPPDPYPALPGICCGLYRVTVSKTLDGKETIPPRYNTQTVLGQEVAADARGIQEGIVFALQSAEDIQAPSTCVCARTRPAARVRILSARRPGRASPSCRLRSRLSSPVYARLSNCRR